MEVPIIPNTSVNLGITFIDWEKNIKAIELEFPNINKLDYIIINTNKKVELPLKQYLKSNKLTNETILKIEDKEWFIISNQDLKGLNFETEDLRPYPFTLFEKLPRKINNLELYINFSYQKLFTEKKDNSLHWKNVLQASYKNDSTKVHIFFVFFCKCEVVTNETINKELNQLINDIKSEIGSKIYSEKIDNRIFILSTNKEYISNFKTIIKKYLEEIGYYNIRNNEKRIS